MYQAVRPDICDSPDGRVRYDRVEVTPCTSALTYSGPHPAAQLRVTTGRVNGADRCRFSLPNSNGGSTPSAGEIAVGRGDGIGFEAVDHFDQLDGQVVELAGPAGRASEVAGELGAPDHGNEAIGDQLVEDARARTGLGAGPAQCPAAAYALTRRISSVTDPACASSRHTAVRSTVRSASGEGWRCRWRRHLWQTRVDARRGKSGGSRPPGDGNKASDIRQSHAHRRLTLTVEGVASSLAYQPMRRICCFTGEAQIMRRGTLPWDHGDGG